jgi:hypothetical protein
MAMEKGLAILNIFINACTYISMVASTNKGPLPH